MYIDKMRKDGIRSTLIPHEMKWGQLVHIKPDKTIRPLNEPDHRINSRYSIFSERYRFIPDLIKVQIQIESVNPDLS